jgi:hypothetical protein
MLLGREELRLGTIVKIYSRGLPENFKGIRQCDVDQAIC